MSYRQVFRLDEYTGMRLGLLGLGVALVGTAFAFTFAPVVGYWIGVVGALTTLVGVVLHWLKNWRRIFGLES